MISRLTKLFRADSSGLTQTALVMGLFMLCGQLLGLVRDRLFAGIVGPGNELDLYYAAFKIPDFLYVSIATMASLTIVLPVLSEKLGQGTDQEKTIMQKTASQIFSVLLMFLVVCSVILWVIMPWLVPLLVPGFSLDSQSQLVILSRILLLQPILMGVSNMFASLTQLFQRFWITSLSPIVYNLGIILGIIFGYPLWGMHGVILGVILGAVCHMGIQIPFLIYEKILPRFTLAIEWQTIFRIIKTSLPRTVGLSLNSFTTLVITSVASLSGTGAISLFTFANNIFNVPVNIIGTTLGTVSFPVLVKMYQQGNIHEMQKTIRSIIKKIFLLSGIAFIAIGILRYVVISLLLGHQNFSSNDINLIAWMLMVFMIGLAAQSSIAVLVRAWYAQGNTRTPLVINLISQIGVITLVYISYRLTKNAQIIWILQNITHIYTPTVTLIMLPVAVTLGNIWNALWLYGVYMRKKQVK